MAQTADPRAEHRALAALIDPAVQRAIAAIEYRDIHIASCRYRRQRLVCSTCSDLILRAQRAVKASVSRSPGRRAAGAG